MDSPLRSIRPVQNAATVPGASVTVVERGVTAIATGSRLMTAGVLCR
jgi:hypothetical protein